MTFIPSITPNPFKILAAFLIIAASVFFASVVFDSPAAKLSNNQGVVAYLYGESNGEFFNNSDFDSEGRVLIYIKHIADYSSIRKGDFLVFKKRGLWGYNFVCHPVVDFFIEDGELKGFYTQGIVSDYRDKVVLLEDIVGQAFRVINGIPEGVTRAE